MIPQRSHGPQGGISSWLSCHASKTMTSGGLKPAIPGSVGRCLIHWATRPVDEVETVNIAIGSSSISAKAPQAVETQPLGPPHHGASHAFASKHGGSKPILEDDESFVLVAAVSLYSLVGGAPGHSRILDPNEYIQAACGDRTRDHTLTKRMLYQLS